MSPQPSQPQLTVLNLVTHWTSLLKTRVYYLAHSQESRTQASEARQVTRNVYKHTRKELIQSGRYKVTTQEMPLIVESHFWMMYSKVFNIVKELMSSVCM